MRSWLPYERENMRLWAQVSAHPGNQPYLPQPGPKASPGLEFIIMVRHSNVPEDDPLVIGGR